MFPGEPGVCGSECSSSPTSGTVFPLFRGFFVFFRVHSVHSPASDLMFRVCGVPESLFGCVGEQPTTADRVPPVGPLLWAGAGIGAAITARHHIAVREFFDDGTEHLSRFTVDPALAGLKGCRRGWPRCRRP
jgi:hypothetical protein